MTRCAGYEWKDPAHLVIHIRDGVRFQDGEKLDAEAVKYKLNRDLTAKGSMRRGEVNSIDSIDVVDPLTVQLNLKAPAAQLLAQLTDRAGIMISPKAAEAAGDKFGLHPVCAGPFSFESRVAQDRIVLRRFPGYWDAKSIHFDQVVYLPNPNSSVRLANLQAGTLDIVEYILPTDVPAVQKDPKLKTAIGDSLAYTGVTVNTGNGSAQETALGKNALVRQAFELAIDREALIQVVYSGMYTPTVEANPPSSPFFSNLKVPARDVAKAKALLQQAGVQMPYPIHFTYSGGTPTTDAEASSLKQALDKAGFSVTLEGLTDTYYDVIQNPSNATKYDLTWAGWGADWPNASTVIPPLFDSRVNLSSASNGQDYGWYSDNSINQAIDAAYAEPDTSKRDAMWGDLSEQLAKNIAYIPLVIEKFLRLHGSKVTNYQENPGSNGYPDLGPIGLSG